MPMTAASPAPSQPILPTTLSDQQNSHQTAEWGMGKTLKTAAILTLVGSAGALARAAGSTLQTGRMMQPSQSPMLRHSPMQPEATRFSAPNGLESYGSMRGLPSASDLEGGVDHSRQLQQNSGVINHPPASADLGLNVKINNCTFIEDSEVRIQSSSELADSDFRGDLNLGLLVKMQGCSTQGKMTSKASSEFVNTHLLGGSDIGQGVRMSDSESHGYCEVGSSSVIESSVLKGDSDIGAANHISSATLNEVVTQGSVVLNNVTADGRLTVGASAQINSTEGRIVFNGAESTIGATVIWSDIPEELLNQHSTVASNGDRIFDHSLAITLSPGGYDFESEAPPTAAPTISPATPQPTSSSTPEPTSFATPQPTSLEPTSAPTPLLTPAPTSPTMTSPAPTLSKPTAPSVAPSPGTRNPTQSPTAHAPTEGPESDDANSVDDDTNNSVDTDDKRGVTSESWFWPVVGVGSALAGIATIATGMVIRNRCCEGGIGNMAGPSSLNVFSFGGDFEPGGL